MSDTFRIKMLSKEGVSTRDAAGREVTEELRKMGLEWKQADWPHAQTVVIVIEPVDLASEERVAELETRLDAVREATER